MAAPWRVARSLDQLLAQINAAHPNRSKAADGSIGDAAHAASKSEHNPDSNGVVRARDFTHDPARGFDAHAMADALIASRDPRILYVISRGRIASSVVQPWRWRAYTGTNRHDHHAHVSVVAEPRLYDSTRPWRITDRTTPPTKGDDDVTPDDIKAIAAAVWATPVPRPGNTPASAGAQLGGANINAYRALAIVRAMQGDDVELIAAVTKAVKAAAPSVNVDELARSIVRQLVDDEAVTP
jgi:hypothetical protein